MMANCVTSEDVIKSQVEAVIRASLGDFHYVVIFSGCSLARNDHNGYYSGGGLKATKYICSCDVGIDRATRINYIIPYESNEWKYIGHVTSV